MLNTEFSQSWHNPVLQERFKYLEQLAKQGWRIELDTIDQISNGYWHVEPTTKLPYPDQKLNQFGKVSLVTYMIYVYPPQQADYLEDLHASFNDPLTAYQWLVDESDLRNFVERYNESEM